MTNLLEVPIFMEFPKAWRVRPPPDGELAFTRAPESFTDEVTSMILQAASRRKSDRQSILETFKSNFCEAAGHRWNESSDYSWATSDLKRDIANTADNAPKLIEAFWNGCEAYREEPEVDAVLPDIGMLNALFEKHGIGYQFDGARLEIRGSKPAIAIAAPSLIEGAFAELGEAWKDCDKFLRDGQSRSAVESIWWVVESMVAAYHGVPVDGDQVKGQYFNEIVPELKKRQGNKFRQRALQFLDSLQNLLSDPSAGQVRHGKKPDLKGLQPWEAELIVHLAKAFAVYLCEEYSRHAKVD